MKFFHDIWAYKCSASLISAFELGIFDALLMKEMDVNELAKMTKSDPVMLGMLLNILTCYGYLKEEDGKFRVSSDYTAQLPSIKIKQRLLSHEKNLMNCWNIPERILKQLRSSGEKNDFIKDNFTLEEQKDYFLAMNEGVLELLFVFIRREYPVTNETAVLEYGRSLGGMSLLCKKKYPNISCDVCFEKEFQQIALALYGSLEKEKGIKRVREELLNHNKYDFIFVYNSIHYYNPGELMELLGRLYCSLKPGKILCISDVYIEKEDSFCAGVLLDWMTHGGIYQQRFRELQELVEHTRFHILKTVVLNQIHNKLLFLTK